MNNKTKKKNELNIKKVWKMFRSDKGKKYSFFTFYFFFFIFLFIFINTNSTTNSSNKNNINNNINNNVKQETSLPFKTNLLENNNYKFKYLISSNLNEILYLGDKVNNTIYINDDTGKYMFNYLNGKLVTNDNINILHPQLFDIYEIKRVIKSSKLISETKLNETNEYIYNYSIKNDNLGNILGNINNLDDFNEISVKTNNNKEIKEIVYNLLNYEKKLNNDLTDFKIKLEIGEFDEKNSFN